MPLEKFGIQWLRSRLERLTKYIVYSSDTNRNPTNEEFVIASQAAGFSN
ncbi:hypothetical protein D515_01329 [Grimontia indica]|uniref:Uncharacterized protein n=1 Tax=Grimontia indica TaxID=1056512 RepID=R1IW90_9GAMM|nr:hypothetical protein D515_01329 [Grimontia indica]